MGNGQVERTHQTIFKMLGTLPYDDKNNWPEHIKALVFAYNSTRNPVTGYSPYYLLMGRRPRIPIDFLFPTRRPDSKTIEKQSDEYPTVVKQSDEYVASLQNCLKSSFHEARLQSTKEADRQKIIYDRRVGSTVLQKGDRVLLRMDAVKGKRKIKDRWGSEVLKVVEKMGDDAPVYRVQSLDGKMQVVHRNRLLFVTRGTQEGLPIVLNQAIAEPPPSTTPNPLETAKEGLSKETVDEGISIPVAPVIGKLSQMGWVLGKNRLLSWPEAGLAKVNTGKEPKCDVTYEGNADVSITIAAEEVS